MSVQTAQAWTPALLAKAFSPRLCVRRLVAFPIQIKLHAQIRFRSTGVRPDVQRRRLCPQTVLR